MEFLCKCLIWYTFIIIILFILYKVRVYIYTTGLLDVNILYSKYVMLRDLFVSLLFYIIFYCWVMPTF